MKFQKLPLSNFNGIEYPVLVSPKYDGVRANIRDGKFVGLSNKLIRNPYVQILPITYNLPEHLDGELVFGGSLRETVGNLNSTSYIDEELTFFVFDYIVANEPFVNRISRLDVIEDTEFPLLKVKKVCHEIVKDEGKLRELIENERSQSYPRGEGLIIRNPAGYYISTRSTNDFKVKFVDTILCRVEGIVPHKAKPDWLGALICKSTFFRESFNVGSGFTEEQRKNLEFSVGDVVRIEYRITEDVTLRPNQPIFKGKL